MPFIIARCAPLRKPPLPHHVPGGLPNGQPVLPLCRRLLRPPATRKRPPLCYRRNGNRVQVGASRGGAQEGHAQKLRQWAGAGEQVEVRGLTSPLIGQAVARPKCEPVQAHKSIGGGVQEARPSVSDHAPGNSQTPSGARCRR